MRKLLALLLTLAMVLSLASVATVAATPQAAEKLTAGKSVGATVEIDDVDYEVVDTLPTEAGHYILCKDITIANGAAQVVFAEGTVLHGDGYAIKIANDYAWSSTIPFDFAAGTYDTPTVLKNITFGTEADPVDFATKASNSSYTTPLFHITNGQKVNWENVDFYVSKATSADGHGITYTMPIFWTMGGVQNFTDCDVVANINAVGQTAIWGLNGDGTVTFNNCTVDGSISGGSPTAGWIKEVNGSVLFENCTNFADVSGTGSLTAGFVAKVNTLGDVDFVNCTNEGNISTSNADNNHVGGFVATIVTTAATAEDYVSFKDCVNKGNVSHTPASNTPNVGGFVGNVGYTYLSFENCINRGTLSVGAGGNLGGILAKATKEAGTLDTTVGKVYMENCSNYGSFVCSNAGNGAGGLLGTNSPSEDKMPIEIVGGGNFVDINCPNARVGGIVQQNNGKLTITNTINTGDITGCQYVGGFVVNASNAFGTTITNCANYGNILATKENSGQAGGFVGYSDADGKTIITNAVNYGNVDALQYASGIMAEASALTMTGCMNFGDITTGHTGGGLVAQLKGNATISNSLNAGDVSEWVFPADWVTESKRNTVKTAESTAGFIGRINSVTNTVSVENCVNVGTITGSTKYNTSYGAFTEQFGQFLGRMNVNMGNSPWKADGTMAAGIAWVDSGNDVTSKITLNNCYGFGVAQAGNTEIAESEYPLTNYTPKNGDVAAFYTYTPAADAETNDTKPTVPNGGAYGNNVKLAAGSTYTMLAETTATDAAAALNALELFPVTFEADGDAVVVDEAPAVKGLQKSNDGKSVRIAATLNSLEGVNNVGFTYTVKVNGATVIDNKTATTNRVLYSVNETVAGQTNKVLAANNGGQYFYTLTFINVPTNATVEITVQATLNGEAVGAVQTITLTPQA